MDREKSSKEKVKEILSEMGHRKEIRIVKIQFARGRSGSESNGEDIIGNVSACTDCDDDSGTEGGAGNVSACADVVC